MRPATDKSEGGVATEELPGGPGRRSADGFDALLLEAGLAWLRGRLAVVRCLAEALAQDGAISAQRLRVDRRLVRALHALIAFATPGRHSDGEAALLAGLELGRPGSGALHAQPATDLWSLRLSWWQRFGGASTRPRLLDRLIAASSGDPRRLGEILTAARHRLESSDDGIPASECVLHVEDSCTGEVIAMSAASVRGLLTRISWIKGPEGSHAVASGRVYSCRGAPDSDAVGLLTFEAGPGGRGPVEESDRLVVRPVSRVTVAAPGTEARS